MGKLRMLSLAALIALLPFSARASRGGASASSAPRSTSSARSAPSVNRSNARVAPQPKNRSGRTSQIERAGQFRSNGNVSVITSRGTLGAVGSHGEIQRSVAIAQDFHSFHWGGGLYFGSYYGAGWYYPLWIYPNFWYWNGSLAYNYNIANESSRSGIKFKLDELSKADRKAVSDGNVYITGDDGKEEGTFGTVGDFSGNWKKALPEEPGSYSVKVVLPDGREIDMPVAVQSNRVTKVALRLDKPSEDEQSDATPTPAGSGQQLIPAAPPKQ